MTLRRLTSTNLPTLPRNGKPDSKPPLRAQAALWRALMAETLKNHLPEPTPPENFAPCFDYTSFDCPAGVLTWGKIRARAHCQKQKAQPVKTAPELSANTDYAGRAAATQLI